MYINLLSFFFIIELIIIFLIIKNYKVYDAKLFIILFPFFYINSFFLDFLLFGKDELYIDVMNLHLSVYSKDYFIIALFNFTFFIGYFLAFLQNKNKYRNNHLYENLNNKKKITNLTNIFLIFSLFYLLIVILKFKGYPRMEVKEFLSENLIISILNTVIFFYCVFYIFLTKNNYILTLITTILLLFSIFIWEREYIFFLFILLISKFELQINLKNIFIFFFMFIAILYYKTAINYINQVSGFENFDNIFEALKSQKNISLAYMDPAGYLLQFKYFLNDPNFIYLDYKFSYFINTIAQFFRAFGAVEWQSMSEFTTKELTGDEMGLTNFMFIESILNFGYVGPFLLGYLLLILTGNLQNFSKNEIHVKIVNFIIIVFLTKFIRTELAVVLKLYILESIIAYSLIYFLQKFSFEIRFK